MRPGHARIRIAEAETELTPEAFSAALDLFAELIACTFANENPHLFHSPRAEAEMTDIAGASATAMCKLGSDSNIPRGVE